jgi:hypothetical protein
MNFRKHISIVLATLILLANLGLSFTVHYCKDEIASISFQFKKEEPCVEKVTSCCSKAASHASCCSDKVIKVQKKTDDILVKTFQLELQSVVFNTDWQSAFIAFKPEIETSNRVGFYCDSHAPPLYKLHCQFVFYA